MRDPEILIIYAQDYQSKHTGSYWTTPKTRKMFEDLQLRLNEHNIDTKSFYDTSCNLWKDYVDAFGMLPLNVLTSDKCFQRYKSIGMKSEEVNIYSLMMHIEYYTACYYITNLYDYPEEFEYDEAGKLPLDYWIENEVSFFPEYSSWEELKELHPVLYRKAINDTIHDRQKFYGIKEECLDYEQLATRVHRRHHGSTIPNSTR